MEAWTRASKVGLGVAFCAVFAAVMWLASDEHTRAQALAPKQAGESARFMTDPGARPAIGDEPSPLPMPTHEEPSTRDPPPAADMAAVTDLSRQVMPVDETTAEEDEQRGDAIRRLSSYTAAGSAQPLIYALRNDTDIRNRILAINGLLRAAHAGSPDRDIDEALIEASRSGDDVIASQARLALAELQRARAR